jgi:hypothetical protein
MPRVLGDTQLKLGEELAWYLENFLDYPFGPNERRAERVTGALRDWGREAFEALFGAGQARDFYRDATASGHTDLHLVVASDSAAVLAWPWEALHDPLVGDLSQLCRIERQLDHLSDPPALPANLSRERIGILLVTARPYEGDVAYRSISRPLVELIRQRGLPAEVTMCGRPASGGCAKSCRPSRAPTTSFTSMVTARLPRQRPAHPPAMRCVAPRVGWCSRRRMAAPIRSARNSSVSCCASTAFRSRCSTPASRRC